MSQEGDRDEGSGTGPRNTSHEKDKFKDGKVLLNPNEWQDPPEHKVISEFHRTGLDENDIEEEDPDLEEWLEHWKNRSNYKVISEYHKEGSPYLDDDILKPASKDEDREDPKTTMAHPPPERGPPTKILEVPKGTSKEGSGEGDREDMDPERIQNKGRPRLQRMIDINTIEFLAYTIIRSALPKRVKYSIKEEGIVDMDVAIMDRDIILNSNNVLFEFPDLSIWRIILAYKGRTVIEMGRGVRNRIKIHKMRVLRVLWDIWATKRKRKKSLKRKRMAELEGIKTIELGKKKAKAKAKAKKKVKKKVETKKKKTRKNI